MDDKTKGYFEQTRNVNWLNTPSGTIWVEFIDDSNGYYIQPEDESLRTTPFGVNLHLIDEANEDLFKEIKTINIESKYK